MSFLSISNFTLASTLPDDPCQKAFIGPIKPEGHKDSEVKSTHGQNRASYSGAGSYLRRPPVDVMIGKMFEKGQSVPPAQWFYLMVQERNHESCDCKPALSQRLLWGTLNKFNTLISSLFGSGASTKTWFKKQLGAQLSRAKGDFDAISDIINNQRNSMLEKFQSSIDADIKYAKISSEIFYLLESAKRSGVESEVYKLIYDHSNLIKKVIYLQNKKIQVEHSGRPVADIEKNEGEYRDISINLSKTIVQLKAIEQKLNSLSKRKIIFGAKHAVDELELLRKWSTRERYRKESQIFLAELYVQLTRLQVLENMLEGDLNGIAGPVDHNYLDRLQDTLQTHQVYLDHPEIFGSSFKKNSQNGVLFSELSDTERYSTAKYLAHKWISIWYQRVEEIDVRIQFSFAVTNVSYELLRFAMRNNLAGTKQTLHKSAKHVWKSLINTPKKIIGIKNSSHHPRPEASYSELQKLEIKSAVEEFNRLFNFVRLPEEHPMNREELRDSFATLEHYFETVDKYNESIHPEIITLLSSAKAVDLHNWIIRSSIDQQSNNPYSLIVASKILQRQLESLARYERLGVDLIENIGVWSAGFATIYSGALDPIFRYMSQYFYGP